MVNPSVRISQSGRWFALDILCQVRLVLNLPKERISNISATPIHRLCTRMKSGMWDDYGNQSLTASTAIEDTSTPLQCTTRSSGESWSSL